MSLATELTTQEQAWHFPTDLEVGQRVVVSTDPHFTTPAAGLIAGLEPNAAWIFLFGGNSSEGPLFGPLEDCWYEGDPRIREQPNLIGQHEGRGIFRLADSEERIKTYAKQFLALEQSLQTFVEKQVEMSQTIKAVEQLDARLTKLEMARTKTAGK